MAKRNKRRREISTPAETVESAPITNFGAPWSKTKRRVASAVILVYLFVLLIGPLANPVASPYLSGPIAEKVSPIHRAMFLGHGYRFFGPEPAPSHRLVYQGKRKDGSDFEGVFPSRENHWPRLLYHRWFMLSETLFNENAFLPSQSQFDERSKQYAAQIESLQQTGNLKLSRELRLEQEIETLQYNNSRQRVEVLGEAIANVLSNRNDAESIQLFIQVRQIPLAEEVAAGMQLEDKSLLSDLIPIGSFINSEFEILSPAGRTSVEIQSTTLKTESDFAPTWEVAK